MTTTEQPNTALATRGWTDQQLKTRIQANINARFGLQDATPQQLNIVYLLAKRWGLDPVNELTLYEGRPFITLDGRLQLMRRHPDYRGYRTRPLNRQEKEDWGYEPDDLAVECTVLTHHTGEVTARGCVRRAEVDSARKRAQDSGKRAAPVGIYAPEIAEKRAIARASRAAFGQDVPDEDEAGYVIEEQRNPATMALNAAAYDKVYGKDDDGSAFADMPAASARDEESSAEDAPAEMVKNKKHPLWEEWLETERKARAAGVEYDSQAVSLPIAENALRESIASLVGMIEDQRTTANESLL